MLHSPEARALVAVENFGDFVLRPLKKTSEGGYPTTWRSRAKARARREIMVFARVPRLNTSQTSGYLLKIRILIRAINIQANTSKTFQIKI